MKYSMEQRFRIFNDDTGERIEVGEDPEGLGMIEIVWVDELGKRGTNIIFTEEALPLLIDALNRRLELMKERQWLDKCDRCKVGKRDVHVGQAEGFSDNTALCNACVHEMKVWRSSNER
jgi:hypothetical protein